MKNKKINIEMADMVGKTYFQIATWYNKDFGNEKERQESLKHTCVELIQQILEDTFLQLDGVEDTGINMIKKEEPATIVNNPLTHFNFDEEAILNELNSK